MPQSDSQAQSSNSYMWLKLQSLRPSLPSHIEFQRREYGGEDWYVLQDHSNGKFHRLNPSAYHLLSFMDGKNSLAAILKKTHQLDIYQSPDDAPTADELIQLLQYLHVADLMVCDFPPSTKDLFARQQKIQRQVWNRLLINPLTWKFRLGNPDAFLETLMPLAKFITSPAFFVCWLLLVGYAAMLAVSHWTQLTSGQLHKVLSPGNLFLLWLIYPVLKIFHELGHGLFTKAWGGHVHEWGVMVILGTPLPYVDASSSIAFKSKTQRILVSAAGMGVELFFAAIALLIWLNVQDGLLRDICFNVMLIGGVSTLFFNGNPLMRYDGYHILTDFCDWPNLATKANQQLQYVVRRFAFGEALSVMPAANPKQAIIFVVYAIAGFFYRLFMLLTIVLLIANHFPRLGLALAIWMVFFQLVYPCGQYFYSLATSDRYQANRRRALTVASGAGCLLLIFIIAVPLPMSTTTEAVVWLPDDARVKAEASGEVVSLFVKDGAQVEKGQALIQLSNNKLRTELAFAQAKQREYEIRYQQVWADNRTKAQLFAKDVEAMQAQVVLLQKRVDALTVVAPSSGTFKLTQDYQPIGSFAHQGDTLAIVLSDREMRLRAVVTQENIGLMRQSSPKVSARLVSDTRKALRAKVSGQEPVASFELPSAALGASGGGKLPVDARYPEGTKTTEVVFWIDLLVIGDSSGAHFGERAYVKFEHPAEPLFFQFSRHLQQLFIRSFQY